MEDSPAPGPRVLDELAGPGSGSSHQSRMLWAPGVERGVGWPAEPMAPTSERGTVLARLVTALGTCDVCGPGPSWRSL